MCVRACVCVCVDMCARVCMCAFACAWCAMVLAVQPAPITTASRRAGKGEGD